MIPLVVAGLFFLGLVVVVIIATIALRRNEQRDRALHHDDDDSVMLGMATGMVAGNLVDMAAMSAMSGVANPGQEVPLDDIAYQENVDPGFDLNFDSVSDVTTDFVDFGGGD